ncbi:MAG: (d)CMP kinase [Firmicutes bacterium]|nr:(d)CMP kinase [Candidatus Colimorpha enterica]
MINIAIDGPSGAGKSYLAREVSRRLGFIYVDTGAMYRAIGLYMLRNGIDPHITAQVVHALKKVSVTINYENGEQAVILNGENVNAFIRTPEVSMAASNVSAIPEVRAFLLSLQKDLAAASNVVMDGRDIGTVILPDADVKIFLCASPEARAKRRLVELLEKGTATTLEEVLADMEKRDENDRNRKIAPAVPAADAFILDNSDLDREGTVITALEMIAAKTGITAD